MKKMLYKSGLVICLTFLLIGASATLMVAADKERAPIDPNLSFAELTDNNIPGLTTCPSGHVSSPVIGPYKYYKVTVKDSIGNPLSGIPADDFLFNVTLGPTTVSSGPPSMTFTPVQNYTDINGEIKFTIVADTSIVGDNALWDPNSTGTVTIEVIVRGVALNDADDLQCISFDYDADGLVSSIDFTIYAEDHGKTNRPRSDFDWDDGGALIDSVDFTLYADHHGHT